MIQSQNKQTIIYCGPNFGFVDSSGNVEVMAALADKTLQNLITILFHKKTYYTTDTTDIINYTNAIKRKYMKKTHYINIVRLYSDTIETGGDNND